MKREDLIDEKALLARKTLVKAQELIHFSVQLSDSICRGIIIPEMFEKRLIIPEPNNAFLIELDWTQHRELFKMTSEDILVGASSHAIISAKECYVPEFWVKEGVNGDLFAAQQIFRLVRNALAHMKPAGEVIMPVWDIRNPKDRRVFEIKKFEIRLDATDLDGKQFRFSQIGGITNLLAILKYLVGDLKERFSSSVSKNDPPIAG